ncbi:serine/threonine-protein kinase [Estrella lausannensis]|uniref:Protein kinase domain-containing protein n=1 Tax=Estrella lausannensis TaxID=483423 RepID=A0A0H5DPH7_9BACT|nr:serine/threonine-protein kinase [Estrella lausannensis]CRX37898.1 hypothetical protein ELAC_0543 [Estrella lausannensis]
MNINTAYGLIQSFAKEMELPKNRVAQDAKPSLDKIASIVKGCMQTHAITADQKAELVNCLTSITNLGDDLSSNQFIAKTLAKKAQNVLKIAQSLDASKLESPLGLSSKNTPQRAESKQQTNISPHVSDKAKSHSHGVSKASRKVFSRRAIVKPEPEVSPPVSDKAKSRSSVASKESSKAPSKPEEISSHPRVEVVKRESVQSLAKKGVKALSGKGVGHPSEKQKALTKALAELLDTPRFERKIDEKLAKSLIKWASDNKDAAEPNVKELARVLDEIHQEVEPNTLRSMQELKTNLKTAIDALRDVEAERVREAPPDRPKKADVNPLLEKSKSIEAKLSKNKSRLQLKKLKKSGSFIQKELHRHETIGDTTEGAIQSIKAVTEKAEVKQEKLKAAKVEEQASSPTKATKKTPDKYVKIEFTGDKQTLDEQLENEDAAGQQLKMAGQHKMTLRKKSGAEKKYTHKRLLGEGGFGDVHEFMSASGRKSKAVKFHRAALPGIASHKAQQLADQFKSPSTGEIVKTVPGLKKPPKIIGTTATGLEVEVSRVYDRGDLDKLNKPIGYEEAVTGVMELAFGLAHLHRGDAKASVVHTDIKPGNVLVQEQDGKLHFVLADLDGLAESEIGLGLTGRSPAFIQGDDLTWLLNLDLRNHPPVKKVLENPAVFAKSLDTRALGVTLKVLMTGLPLEEVIQDLYEEGGTQMIKPEMTYEDLRDSIKSNTTPQQEEMLKKMCAVINKMTDEDWTKRISMEDALDRLAKIGFPMPEYR